MVELSRKEKWWASMIAKHGSEQAVRLYMKGYNRRGTKPGTGGFYYLSLNNPEYLAEISAKGVNIRKSNESQSKKRKKTKAVKPKS
jgi:hypothetical protein